MDTNMSFEFECPVTAGYRRNMKNFILVSVSIITVTSISACSTIPKAEEVCTTEWISKRTGKALNNIETKAGSSIKALSKAAQSWSKGRTPNLFQMLALRNSFKGLENELRNGRGMKDLKTVASTCNDPKIISDTMGKLLRKQDLPPNLIDFIENFEPYQRLITPEPDILKTAQLLTK